MANVEFASASFELNCIESGFTTWLHGRWKLYSRLSMAVPLSSFLNCVALTTMEVDELVVLSSVANCVVGLVFSELS